MTQQTFSREADVKTKPDRDSRVFEVAFSSETPVERWGELEILSHASGAARLVRLNNGASLLFNHDRDRYIGVVEPGTARIDADRVGRAKVRIKEGADGDAVLRDVRDGILTKISFLYRIHASETAPARDGKDAYLVTDWEPLEISFVTVPADDSVGLGRSLSIHSNLKSDMDNNNEPDNTSVPVPASAAPEPNKPEPRAQVVENATAARFFALADLAKSVPDARELAEKALLRGIDEAAFRKELLREMELRDEKKPKESAPVRGFAGDFLSARDLSKYSVMKAVRAAAAPGDPPRRGKKRALKSKFPTNAQRRRRRAAGSSSRAQRLRGAFFRLRTGTATPERAAISFRSSCSPISSSNC